MADITQIHPYLQRRELTERIKREFPGALVTSHSSEFLVAHVRTPQGSVRVFIVRNESDLETIHRAVAEYKSLRDAYTGMGF